MTFTHMSASRTRTSATRGLSSALRDLRQARGLTVYAVCKQTGISRSVLEAAEVDADGTKYGVLVVLAEFYGLPETTDLIALGNSRGSAAAA
ncbi:transcriptional regulator with XRE-family HTH domain [Promicromonospora iranensis]|uniref:Transcriptional regulator with XRE-family HTH domain n=3 Tax=Promicromonospora iranensis TaxID=1105144 RepID=A0ABU2CV86_9MICO|nr:transcriptional regulator with XRE-family HTH domain [Promicromonospora iranensis]